MAEIREHMKIVGKDGTQVGTVDRVEGNRIKLIKGDSPVGHQDHHHFIDLQLVGAVDGDIVKLTVTADALPKFEREYSNIPGNRFGPAELGRPAGRHRGFFHGEKTQTKILEELRQRSRARNAPL